MPNADVILMLKCSLRFPGVLVEGVRKLYRGADGRAIFETLFWWHPGISGRQSCATPTQNQANSNTSATISCTLLFPKNLTRGDFLGWAKIPR